MKILLTGATGFVGKKLAATLFAQGHSVSVLGRKGAKSNAQMGIPCTVFEADLENSPPARDAFAGVDAVIHLAGEPIAGSRWTEERKRRIRDSRVIGSHHLMDAIESLEPGKRPGIVISASAVGFYGDRADEELTEKSTKGSGFLSDVCADWEKEILAREIPGVRRASLRFGMVLGRGGGSLELMLPLFGAGLGGNLGNGQQWMSWIHVDDLISLIFFTLHSQAADGVLNAVAPHPVRNRDFTTALAQAVGKTSFVPAPKFALKAALGEMSDVVLSSQRVLPERALQLGFAFQYPDIDGALKNLCHGSADDFFESTQFVMRPIDEVFEFFSNAKNLEALTPSWVNFQIKNVSTREMQTGTLIDYSLKIHGVPVSWRTRIDAWNPGVSFVDVQLKGPYTKWHHTHTFQAVAGGTLIHDRVLYRLPVGLLGKSVAGGFVRKDVQKIFAFRREAIDLRFPRAP